MKILIVTSYFPSLDYYEYIDKDPRTKFLLFYINEWVDAGHEVNVLHVPSIYPVIFNYICKLLQKLPYLSKLKFLRFSQNRQSIEKKIYRLNGFGVMRIPILKLIPKTRPLLLLVPRLIVELNRFLSRHDFSPDLILSDFVEPNLALTCQLKEIFPLAKTAHCFHSTDENYIRGNKGKYSVYLDQIESYLFRSEPSRKLFCDLLNLDKAKCFFMYSGIPNNSVMGKPRYTVSKFLYVGTIRRSKGIFSLIDAFNRAMRNTDCTLTIVGDGPDYNEMVQKIYELDVSRRIFIKGRQSREAVFEFMDAADCLVMVSKETFGMVYVEAMSKGNIVVGAKGQGIDGVVVNNDNGFLCQLDSEEELSDLLIMLNSLNQSEVHRVSTNALITSGQLRDSKLAKELLAEVM